MASTNRLAYFYRVLLIIGIILLSIIERVESSCSFSRNFGSGNSLSVSDLVGFNTAADAGTTCSVTCDSGSSTQLYARYGGNADLLFNDGSDFSTSSCSVSVALSSSTEQSQLGYSLSVRGPYTNLAISCSCTNEADESATSGGGGTACFSESASVQVFNRGSVTMKDLQIGDKVLTYGDKYQPIYAFGHYLQNEEQEFFQIHSKDHNSPLEMTGDHLIFMEDKNGHQRAVRADALQVGDSLITEDATTRVTKITKIKRKGMYMPLTPDGTLVVDGIKASAYISIHEHAASILRNQAYFGIKSEDTILHWWLCPIRMICMGVSSSFCDMPEDDDPLTPTRSDRGILKWLVIGKNVAMFAERQSFAAQVLVLGPPVFAFFAFLILLETVFGPSVAPSAVAMIVAGVIILWFIKTKRKDQLS